MEHWSLKKKWTTDLSNNKDDFQKHYAKWEKLDQERLRIVSFHFYGILEKAEL